jgi:uncharacterized protein YgfB (UPF0149 family)
MSNSLERLAVPLSVSEVHGLCCGLLCALPSASAKTRWFTEVLDAASLTADSVHAKAADLKQLDEWFSGTLSAMNDVELEFYPCLPDDDVPVDVRIRALADFCSGFTYGIGLAGAARGNKSYPPDTREIIDDFQAIEAADERGKSELTDVDTDNDVNSREHVFHELLEYVRVGVLLVLEELRPVSAVKQKQPS